MGSSKYGLTSCVGVFRKGNRKREVQGEYEDQAAVHYVIGFGASVEGESECCSEENEIPCPEYTHEVHPKLSELTFLVHRMPLFSANFRVCVAQEIDSCCFSD